MTSHHPDNRHPQGECILREVFIQDGEEVSDQGRRITGLGNLPKKGDQPGAPQTGAFAHPSPLAGLIRVGCRF